MKIGLILACAGEGRRLGFKKNKVFLYLNKKPIFYYSYRNFSSFSQIKWICVVTQKRNFSLVRKTIPFERRLILVEGGERRQDSVEAALKVLKDKDIDYIIIHDGARPLIKKEKIKELILSLKKYPAVILGLPLKEAIKYVERDFVVKSLRRENLYIIQAPQGFRKDLILKAYDKFNRKRNFYDDAQLVELLRRKIKVVEGDPFNIKITYPADLKLVSLLLDK